MKGSPALPGGPLTSKPTWFSTFWVFNRVGFFSRRCGTVATTENEGELDMKARQALMWVASGVVGLGLLGCDVFVGGPGHSPRERVYVERQQPEYVIVREAPPPVVVERRPSPPSRVHVWIDGYWHWSGQKYAWDRGHWALPPHGRAVWVAPRYDKHEQGYRYTPGQWREEQQERRSDDERRDRR